MVKTHVRTIIMETKFYEVSQNNSGGSFDVNEKVCHRLFIEAKSEEEATSIAEDLGCYWNGVSEGMDCPCCGDRWYGVDEVNLNDMNTKWNGYEVAEWLDGKKHQSESEKLESFKSKYSGFTWLVEPVIDSKYGSRRVIGRVKLDNIEQYAQILANLYGWTTPDARIFYLDGNVKEIHKNK